MSSQNGKIICRKTARCSGKKHISKSKCQKHGGLRLVWKDTCSTVLGREAHLQVKMHQKHVFGPLLEVQASKHWRACPSQNAHSRPLLESRIGVFRLLFGRSYAEKPDVAGKTFRSQMSKHQGSNHLWRITSRKNLLLWQETYWQVKMSKGIGVSDTFERSHAEKKYTSLWQGHVFQVKPIFEAPTVHAVAKSKFPNKISKTNHFWKITGQQSLWQEPYFHVNISKT